jgi:hypothetical protein
MKRFTYSIFLIISIFFFPWWVVFTFGFFGVIVFQNYFEIILIGICYDLLFHGSMLPWYKSIEHTLIALSIFITSLLLKKILRK